MLLENGADRLARRRVQFVKTQYLRSAIKRGIPVLHEGVQKLPREFTEESSAYSTLQNDKYYRRFVKKKLVISLFMVEVTEKLVALRSSHRNKTVTECDWSEQCKYNFGA
jgi:hypothetical protein